MSERSGIPYCNRSRSLSLDSPNWKRAEMKNAPVVAVLPENESTVIHANNLERGASCGPRSSCSLNWRREFRSLVPTSKNCQQRPFVQLSLRQQVLGFTTRLVGCVPWKVERHSVIQTKDATVTFYAKLTASEIQTVGKYGQQRFKQW